MKKFLVFTFYADRPLGGIKDFLADFDTLEDALDNILEERRRYYQIVDSKTMKTVKEGLSLFKRFETGEFSHHAKRRKPSGKATD